ncbi:hypothetical protein GCM10011501_05070 [Thalassotalea profundi]|uniref:Uncharacterized protein n=2 Tax=Thalassotalea profundi TaxID=2036687 RepID=A0ABQ3IFD4_9GAMM|nr:hypothetical protein GCM10011501_05070 [Thalassotalea profundi]
MKHIKDKYQNSISSILLDGFEVELLDSAFINLLTPNPLRLNNFAYALRELTRHMLHRLAPNDELEKCCWFKPDSTSSNGITRKQRIKFCIQGGLSDFYVEKKLRIDEIDTVTTDLVAIISQLSNFTHIERATFNIDEAEVEKVAIECLDATLAFVNKINELRELVAEKLFGDISDNLMKRINSESVAELMEISTHQFVEDITAETVSNISINSSSLEMTVVGTIYAQLMYGSASDRRKEDGAEIPVSFPVTSSIEVIFKQPLGCEMNLDSFNVDISSWYE